MQDVLVRNLKGCHYFTCSWWHLYDQTF